MTIHEPVCQALYDIFEQPKGAVTKKDWAQVWAALKEWKKTYKYIEPNKCMASEICVCLSNYDSKRGKFRRHHFWHGIQHMVNDWAVKRGMAAII